MSIRTSRNRLATCLGCGDTFIAKHGLQSHCRKGCGRKQSLFYRGVCQSCGLTFRASHNNQEYCSRNCRDLSRARPYKCESCGEMFARIDGHTKRLCRKCRDASNKASQAKTLERRLALRRQRQQEREAQPHKTCAWCGNEYKATRLDQKYCCDHCNNIAKKKRRQARLRSGERVRSPSLGEIYRRDRGVCQLCKTRVGRKYKWPHGRSPSLDHIVPVSIGGSDAARNIQLAHLGCNMKKQNKNYGSQLRFF